MLTAFHFLCTCTQYNDKAESNQIVHKIVSVISKLWIKCVCVYVHGNFLGT